MTQKNNKNTDREKELFAMDTTLPLITPQQTPDQSSNYLPLIMAGAGLIGYTLYNKYKTNCSLDGKEINLVIETPGQSGNSRAVIQAIINKTVTKNVYSLSPNGALDEDDKNTWGTFEFVPGFTSPTSPIANNFIKQAELTQTDNGNLSVSLYFSDDTFSFGEEILGVVGQFSSIFSLVLYPNHKKTIYSGFSTTPVELSTIVVDSEPVVSNTEIISGKCKLRFV